MAHTNKDWAFGLQPMRDPYGNVPDTFRFPISINTTTGAPSYTTKIFKGAPVGWNGTAGVVIAHADTNDFVNCVGIAAEYFRGSASGTTKTDLAVWPIKEDTKWLIQSDGGTTTTNRASYLMKLAAMVNMTAGNTNTGISGIELDYSSLDATGAGPLRVVGFSLAPGNTVAGANVDLIVTIVGAYGFERDATIA